MKFITEHTENKVLVMFYQQPARALFYRRLAGPGAMRNSSFRSLSGKGQNR